MTGVVSIHAYDTLLADRNLIASNCAEARSALKEAEAELKRHHRVFQQISALLEARADKGELTGAEREIRNLVG